MNKAIIYKILQGRYKFRNQQNLVRISEPFDFSDDEIERSESYLKNLKDREISYTYPEEDLYPREFLKMKEPPLFLEYQGQPLWQKSKFLSVVGSRNLSSLTASWMKTHLEKFLLNANVGVVSGGAIGVDQLAHSIAMVNKIPTIFVLPSGLRNLYPNSLEKICQNLNENCCLMSEFEFDQKVQKSHFYFRNRLIAALGKFTLVTQASLKSGSLLTVHHSLEIGKPVVTVPAHPELLGFDGNLKLIQDGAFAAQNDLDLLEFWNAENWPN